MSDTEKQHQNIVHLNAPDGRPQPATITNDILDRIVEETSRRIEARTNRPSPVELRTFEEIEHFADIACRTDMVPKDYKGKADNIIIAVMFGKELGLPAIQALQSIAVVNGRPSLWGDAVPGLCWASGKCEDIAEFFEGTPGTDDYTAVCTVKRKGAATAFVGKFSQADAKQAGLFGTNVHKGYPKRMAQWRARHYACHDAFPDVLRGIGTAEVEAEDAAPPGPQWTMPRPEQSWFARKATARTDGWDDTWFEGFVGKLIEEPNAWKWLGVLTTGLAEAPTIRDVKEIGDLPVVQKARDAAPEEARASIDQAFADAEARLAPAKTDQKAATEQNPARTEAEKPKPQPKTAAAKKPPAATGASAQPPAGAAPSPAGPSTATVDPAGDASTFEVFLVDEFGDPVGDEPYMTPVGYAAALWNLYNEKQQDESIIHQNADGIADAKAADPAAAEMLATLGQAEEQTDEPAIVPIEIPKRGDRPDYATYVRTFKATVAAVTAENYLDRLAADMPTLQSLPASSRMLCVKAAVERAHALGIEPPAGLAQVTRAPAQTKQPETKPTEQPQPEQQTQSKPVEDRDAKAVGNLIAELADCASSHDAIAWSNRMTTTALRNRLEREGRSELVGQMDAAFNARMAEMKGRAANG